MAVSRSTQELRDVSDKIRLYEDVVKDKVNSVVAKRAVLLEDLREILTTADGTVVEVRPNEFVRNSFRVDGLGIRHTGSAENTNTSRNLRKESHVDTQFGSNTRAFMG